MRVLLAVAAISLSACVTRGEIVASTPPPVVSGGVEVSVGAFESDLSPYGQWLSTSSYGRCWQPSQQVVGYEFQPYSTGGSWVWTDAGWQFESDYPFGWATFHYGRWLNDPYTGWCWVPGDEWAPSWVTWRFGSGYVGWSPLPPAGYVVRAPPTWTFVAAPYFVSRDVHRYRLGERDYHRAYQVTRPVAPPSRGGYVVGPPPSQIASMTGRPVPTAPPARGRPPPGGVMRPSPQVTTPPGRPVSPSAPPPRWNQPPPQAEPMPAEPTPGGPPQWRQPPGRPEHAPAGPPPTPGGPPPPGVSAPAPQGPVEVGPRGPVPGSPPPRAMPQPPVATPPQGVPAAPPQVSAPPPARERHDDEDRKDKQEKKQRGRSEEHHRK